MSAPAELRAPASTWQVARSYLGVLGSGGGARGIALAVPFALLGWYYGPGAGLLTEAWLVLELMVVLALLHARGAGHAGGPDDALPLGRARHDLLRIACGAAWAAASVLVLIGLSALVGLATYGLEGPTKPSLAMLSALPAGFSLYAIAAAVRLRSRRYLLWLLAAFPLVIVALLAAIPAAAWLAVAAATMCLLAATDPGTGRLRARTGTRRPGALRRTAQRPLKPRGSSMPPIVGTRRRPASLLVVFGREARMAPGRIGVVALPLLFVAIVVLVRVWVDLDTASAGVVGPAPSASNVLTPLCFLAFFVCRVGNGSEYDGALPMGIATRHALRVGAGAMWLGAVLLAVAAVGVACGIGADVGSLPVVLRTWAGASGAALLTYLLVSVPILLSVKQPGRAGLVYASVWAAVWWLTRELAPGVAALLPWTALAAIVGPPTPAAAWAPALALWLPLAVLAVPAAAAIGARFEHKEWGRSARPARPALGAAAGGAA